MQGPRRWVGRWELVAWRKAGQQHGLFKLLRQRVFGGAGEGEAPHS